MQKYHIIIFGCQMNIADAEKLATVLESAGYEKSEANSSAEALAKADLVAIVMCSVRQSAVDRVHWLAEKFKKTKAKTLLTGCILKKDKRVFEEKFDYVVDIKDISNLKKIARECALERTSQAPRQGSAKGGRGARIERATAGSRALAEEHFPSDNPAYVPIMNGCNNFCTYCVVPYTRGREISYPAKKVIAEVKKILKASPPSPRLQRAREIWLLGQNVNSYKDGKTNFPKLLKMVNDIPGNFVLNFMTSHPKDFSDELIETMAKCEKLSHDLNLPIQSGDDEILRKMNRPYTVTQYKNLVKKIRKALPKTRLSTDIIVGFPGETKKQFNNTVKVLKEIKYGVAFVNKYSPRAGTVASKLKDDVPWEEKKRREKILIDLVNKK